MDGAGLEPTRLAAYGPKPYASADSATRPHIAVKKLGHTGFEPVTLRLRGACSTVELMAR